MCIKWCLFCPFHKDFSYMKSTHFFTVLLYFNLAAEKQASESSEEKDFGYTPDIWFSIGIWRGYWYIHI